MLHFTEYGPTDAPTVLLLHGGGGSGWTWRAVAERLSEYRCVVPDLPEHGRSAEIGPFTMKRAALEIAALIEASGSRANVVGLSLGGQVAVQLLATRPDLVERAVVSGTLVRPYSGLGLIAPLIELSIRLYMPLKDRDFWIRANMRSYGFPAEFEPEFRADTRLIRPDSFARLMRANLDFRLPVDLARATAPTLVIAGERELGAIKRSARDLVAALPNARGVIARGLGHNWPVAAPDLAAATIRAWLAGGQISNDQDFARLA